MRILFLSLLLFTGSQCNGQSTDPVAVAQKQLDTYNAQNLDGFVNCFSEDAEVFINLGDSVAGMVGRDQIRERYGKMFQENPDNKSTLIGRMVQGNFVFDHEWITGRKSELKIMAIYEVEDGLIRRCWFAR